MDIPIWSSQLIKEGLSLIRSLRRVLSTATEGSLVKKDGALTSRAIVKGHRV